MLDTTSAQYQFVKTYVPAMLQTFFAMLKKNNERLQLWADLSNTINNVVIENGSGGVWNKVRYFVTTPLFSRSKNREQFLGFISAP